MDDERVREGDTASRNRAVNAAATARVLLHEACRQTVERPRIFRALQNRLLLYLLLPLLEQHPIEVRFELERLPIPGDFADVQRYAPVALVKVIKSEFVEVRHVFML